MIITVLGEATERRHGHAHRVNVSGDDGDDRRKPEDQHGESLDGAYGSDDVYNIAEQRDQFEEISRTKRR